VTSLTVGGPIIVERSLYLSTNGLFWNAGHASAGVTAPSTDWFLAEGATGFFDDYLLLANPGARDANVTIDYLLTGGTLLSRTETVSAQSRKTVWVNAESIGGVSFDNVELSTQVHADVPILVERAMWWPRGIWNGAHNSPGATTTGTKYGLAGGEQGGARNMDTWMLVANTSPFAGRVRVTLLFEDRAPSPSIERDLPPNSRTTIWGGMPEFEATGRRFGAIVESLPVAAGTAQIVVERAIYSDALGVRWIAGTDLTATKLQ
jgi:hypothetical protein